MSCLEPAQEGCPLLTRGCAGARYQGRVVHVPGFLRTFAATHRDAAETSGVPVTAGPPALSATDLILVAGIWPSQG